MSLRIVFMGTPEFAVPSLKALVRAGYEVVGVVCQPDRPRGRSGKLAPCEVKAAALELLCMPPDGYIELQGCRFHGNGTDVRNPGGYRVEQTGSTTVAL